MALMRLGIHAGIVVAQNFELVSIFIYLLLTLIQRRVLELQLLMRLSVRKLVQPRRPLLARTYWYEGTFWRFAFQFNQHGRYGRYLRPGRQL